MNPSSRTLAAAGMLLLLLSPVVAAQQPDAPSAAEETRLSEEILITHPLGADDLSQASEVLSGEALQRNLSTSIGDTLALQPGIHSASFGKAVSRPVIHGLSGPRVRVMQDRIDALDVSVTSADHAVTVDPFTADKIEVLKGASTLLYGSGAIGGVVDLHTARIPHRMPDQLQGGVQLRYDGNTEGLASALKLDGRAGNMAWHVDGAFREGDDYQIPNAAESARMRALEGEDEAPTGGGALPGSDFEFQSPAVGASYIADWGFTGLSVSRIDADYGLPGGHGHGHEEDEHEEEGHEEAGHDEDEHDEEEGMGEHATLQLEQTRLDYEIAVRDPFAAFNLLNIRLAINDYEHNELEPNGEVGARFVNEAYELRTELGFEWSQWAGVLGLQHSDRQFSVTGEEAFVPPVDTQDTGIFWVAERPFADMDLEVGLRLGSVTQSPLSGQGRDFSLYAVSAGLIVPLAADSELGIAADISSRAPVAEELYSNGPHLASGIFEVGEPNLEAEQATNLAATFRHDAPTWQARITVYSTQFGDFIYQQPSGEEEDELPVFQYLQNDATLSGLDLEVEGDIAEWSGGQLELHGIMDFVDAQVDIAGNDRLPRIPPLRYGIGLHADFVGGTYASVHYMRVTAQDEPARAELATDAYDDVRLYVGTQFELQDMKLNVFLSGRNLTDDEQRHHTSLIKDLAPAPGRTIETGIRLQF